MMFDAHAALNYACRFARPRLAGGREAHHVSTEITALLTKWGWQVRREEFVFSTAYQTVIVMEVLMCMALAVVSLAVRWISPWAAVPPAAALVLVVVGAPALNRRVQSALSRSIDDSKPHSAWERIAQRLGRQLQGANLVATLPNAPSDSTRPHVLLVAHYDSKSQRLPIVWRVICFALAMPAGLLFVALTGLYALSAEPMLGNAVVVAGGLALCAGAPLLALDTGDASPGAIDNASGLGVVLQLAEKLAQSRDWQERLRMTILFTDAEEMGVIGAAAYVRRHGDALRRDAHAAGLHVLNFDGVGVDAELRVVGASAGPRNRGQLANWIEAAARAHGLQVKPFAMVGLSYDHVPFAEAGFDAVSLIAIGRATWAVHTPYDTVEQLHPRGFAQAGAIAMRVIDLAGLGR
ncbi:MAG: M28 family peptidase [Anaerolineae bacterium]|nr:M28 family metallopeptidase [Thermoflexales bacterium]MDW8407541.1 M28 family peptidase [Anaerolineae bacterium]